MNTTAINHIEVARYAPQFEEAWNAFVAKSKNGTFLLDRRYMDYHSDRFQDHSLLFYEDGQLIAVLPANEKCGTLYSHQGLTYGGLLMDDRCTVTRVITLFKELNKYLNDQGIERVVYKSIPHIYHCIPSEEDLYALTTVCSAQLVHRDVSSAISTKAILKWKRDRHYAANKARTDGITVECCDDFELFWPILASNLQRTYGATPVHTLEEMLLLKSRFPDNIQLYLAKKADGTPLAGTVLYVTPYVVHAQYISATPEGKHLHAVDALYDRIIRHDYAHHPYIDFGKSTESDGTVLNESLIYQKEGFGARAVCYDWYEWVVTR